MTNNKSQKFYDTLFENEDHYGIKRYCHGWTGNFHRQRLRVFGEIFKKIRIDKKKKVLEIGGGTSILGQIYPKEKMPAVTVTDISTKMVEKGKKLYPHINFKVDDALNPKIKAKFDLVLASEIIEHLPEPEKAISAWTKLLKKNGFLVISTPNKSFAKENKEHTSLLTINRMKNLLKKNNLKLLRVYGVDLPIPCRNFAGKILQNIPHLSNFIFSILMKIPKNTPSIAYDVFYVAKK